MRSEYAANEALSRALQSSTWAHPVHHKPRVQQRIKRPLWRRLLGL